MKRLAIEFRDQKINMSLPDAGVLSAMVTVVDQSDRDATSTDEVHLELGGLDFVDGRHPRWGKFNLVPGETVRITLHNDRIADPEKRRTGETESERLESKRNYVRMVAAELGWKILED